MIARRSTWRINDNPGTSASHMFTVSFLTPLAVVQHDGGARTQLVAEGWDGG